MRPPAGIRPQNRAPGTAGNLRSRQASIRNPNSSTHHGRARLRRAVTFFDEIESRLDGASPNRHGRRLRTCIVFELTGRRSRSRINEYCQICQNQFSTPVRQNAGAIILDCPPSPEFVPVRRLSRQIHRGVCHLPGHHGKRRRAQAQLLRIQFVHRVRRAVMIPKIIRAVAVQ